MTELIEPAASPMRGLALQVVSSTNWLELAKWSAILLVCLVVGSAVIKTVMRRGARGERGDEFTSYGLKGLHERGVISEDEYKVIRRKMAERVKQQIEEEERRKTEAAGPQLPTAIALAQEAESAAASAAESAPARVTPADSLLDLDAPETRGAPPPADSEEITDEEIARLQREEAALKRRMEQGPDSSRGRL